MTTADPGPAPATRTRWLPLLLVVLLAGAGVGAYFLWWPRKPVVPAISTEGRDAEVVAAIEQARAGVEARPKSAAAWGRLGMVLFANDMYPESAGILVEAERRGPDDARWPYFRGLALILQEPEEGIALLERAAALAPHTPSVRLRLAEECFKLGRIDEAEALFRDLLADHPDNPRALLGRGQILSRRGQWQEALAPLKAAAEHPTARRSARVALAETYLRSGDAAAAEAERQRAAEAPADLPWPDPFLDAARPFQTGLQPRIDRALALLRNGQIEEAGALMSQVLHDHPQSDEAHLTMGKVLIQGGAPDEAQKELRRAIELNPGLVNGHFLLAGAQMLQQDFEAAERSYLRTIALKPTHGLAHLNLGNCLLKQGRRVKGLEAFRNAVRHDPDLADAHLELGALLLQDGEVEEALPHLETAVRLDGKNDRARGLLAQARAKQKPPPRP